MKLYYAAGTCALAPLIVAREAGIHLTLEGVDLPSRTVTSGGSLLDVSPKGQVPLLEITPVEVLSEGPVICQYLADQVSALTLMPAPGTPERYRVMEWQNFVTSELHKTYSVLFSRVSDDAKAHFGDVLHKKYSWVEAALKKGSYLTGETFTAADAYLFVVTRWAPLVRVDLNGYTALQAFMARVAARPAVREALTFDSAFA